MTVMINILILKLIQIHIIVLLNMKLLHLHLMQEEEILKEMILQAQEQMPKELGRHLLEKTLQYADYRAKDDMTVLVAGIWRK